MQLMKQSEDYQVQSMIGPGEMPRETARGEIQGMLDGFAQQFPPLVAVAESWRDGSSGDTVSFDALTWVVFEHEPGKMREGSQAVLEEFAARDRERGFDAQVARLPNTAS